MLFRLCLVLSCAVTFLLTTTAQAEQLPHADQVKATFKPYQVSPNLAEVVNARLLKANKAQRALLQKNLFVVTPTQTEQLFYIYENNDYGRLPSFVTTDLVLQLFHVFYDFTLRRIESRKLLPLARRLALALLKQSMSTYEQLTDAAWKEAALRNVAYFGVAARLLGAKAKIPQEAQPLVKKELQLIAKHEGFTKGAIFPYQLDYSQFVVRGHYTRTRALRHYFKGMLWFGLCPFSWRRQVASPSGARSVESPETVRSALLLTSDLYQARQLETWQRIYEPTAFFVGAADDLTPQEVKALMDRVFGKDQSPAALSAAPDKLAQVMKKGLELRQAAIQPRLRHIYGGLLPAADPRSPQLRLMGQRYLPDSEMTQKLVYPGGREGAPRYFPSGLDVMAVLGSERARHLLDQAHPGLYQTRVWKGYSKARASLEQRFAATTEKEWTRNMYWGWLWALQALVQPVREGYPSFMRNSAWQDKSLSSALASWAELRHDTILYGKQSLCAAECGGDEEDTKVPRGFVEPNLELYRRLHRVTTLAREGLSQRKLISRQLKDHFERLGDLLVFLHRVSQKELTGKRLSRREFEQIRIIGASVEYLTLSLMQPSASSWSDIISPTDRNMAMIADVHTGGEAPNLQVLEEAVGPAQEILVIVPVAGKLRLTRGAVFSYYEFLHPQKDRLTDEAWQKMLKRRKEPAAPPWTRSFRVPKSKRKGSLKVIQYSSGC